MDLKKKRWFILGASLIINLCIGSGYAWSVFAGPLIKTFGWTAAATALTFTIANAVSPITMITGGKIQDKYGPKWVIFAGGILFGGGIFLSGLTTSLAWLYVSYGIIAGFGMGLVYSCTIANTVKFFPDKRGLVGGLATAGYGSGAIIFAPVAQQIIASSGVLFTFKTLGIIYLIIILAGSQFIITAPAGYKPEGWEPPAITASSANTGKDKTWSQMLADPLFYLLVIMFIIGAMAGLMIISQASPIAQEVIGVEPALAALAVSCVAIANTTGRVVWGWVSDKIGRYNALPVMYILSGLMMFALSTVGAGDFGKFVPIVMAIGFCFGGFMGVFPALTADSFGAKNNGVNYGFMFTGFAIGGYVGPVMAATVKAANNGDYTNAFLIAAALSLVGILLTFIVREMRKKAVRKASSEEA
ncbi:OFA family MFS transporter [Sinanaerobacter chloroacetimidivorans]|uniref:OFA family MFS transporter n=1 Tax=Sinanaerobacter chloroacetimidivorans TaxID=2818044 RepID=A0A8J8B389_9FIRM|nr:OFA family MFS transporter [Sinanaerobacter chloroacetimidivorans]MBR0600114.1 OFA family MFS transporter [Sinanaerobacter chloroacetimidivorans]